MEDGYKYMFTIQGVLKFLAVAFSCTTFALHADAKVYLISDAQKWVLAAFIIAFSISFLLMFFRLIGLSAKMQCDGGPCSYDGIDFLWSWFCTSWCFAAAMTFALNYPNWSNAEIVVSIVSAYLTFIVYAIEAYYLRLYAPANFGFVATKHGWIKTLIIGFGAATFALLVASGYPDWCTARKDGCVEGLTYSLVAFTVSWSVTALLWIVHLVAPTDRIEGSGKLKTAELIWAVLGVLLFWTGASVFAAYMAKDCSYTNAYEYGNCQKRLSGVIAGFITGVFYLVEAIVLK